MAVVRPLYGVVMYEAAASGDLKKMKDVVAQAEKHLAEHGNVATALEMLKLEVAKLEARKGQ